VQNVRNPQPLRGAALLAAVASMFILISGCSQSGPPDFTIYADVKEKKQAFFDYLLPMVRITNEAVWEERKHLLELSKRTGDKVELQKLSEWQSLIRKYKVDDLPMVAQQHDALLSRVDVVPTSLVLAQAANESAWGSSRFAKDGNNLLSNWGFEPGCGITPANRDLGKNHEVATSTQYRSVSTTTSI
tara:strand:- start:2222 stop:2785 length:564 start_codon:yes stop_codon:yes gene_type:complete